MIAPGIPSAVVVLLISSKVSGLNTSSGATPVLQRLPMLVKTGDENTSEIKLNQIAELS